MTIPAQPDVALQSTGGALPVLVFSPGNPTAANWYSQICGELASRGVVVAAVTHRDGSSPATVVKFENGTAYNLTGFTEVYVK